LIGRSDTEASSVEHFAGVVVGSRSCEDGGGIMPAHRAASLIRQPPLAV
jgi:hypothetical protein